MRIAVRKLSNYVCDLTENLNDNINHLLLTQDKLAFRKLTTKINNYQSFVILFQILPVPYRFPNIETH